MPRQARRAARIAPRLETLEPRALLNGSSLVGPQPLTTAAPTASDELFVRFSPSASAGQVQSALGAIGGYVVQAYPQGPSLVALAPGSSVTAAVRALESNPSVVYAESDAPLQSAAVYPTDPAFSQQWGLNSGNDVDIDAPEAWSATTGSPGTIVAVLDTGIDLHNPEFAGRIWVNPDPSGSDGYPGDDYGWDFTTGTNNVQDTNGHGTHVAGILGANANNGVGGAGVNGSARLMDVKVLDSQGNGSTDAAVAGIYYAVAHGAKVINASWGGSEYSQAMVDALTYADSNGTVFVTAAGNDGTNNDQIPTFPASYRLPNELVVAALDQNGNLASFSNYGPHTVDLAAPGVNIYSTIPGGYASYSGTSMATPFVSGVVSLVFAQHPEYNAEQAIQQVRASVKPLPGLYGLTITGGIVDAARAVGVSGSGQNGGGPASVALQQLTPPVPTATTKAKAHPARKVIAHPRVVPHPRVVRHPAVAHAHAAVAQAVRPQGTRLS